MKSLQIFISIITLGVSTITTAQNKNIKKLDQQGIQGYIRIKLSNKWMWSADGGFRFNEMFKDPSYYIMRSGLNYQLNSHMKVTAGFAHLGFYTTKKLSKAEDRPYQEFSITDKYGKCGILHRFRIEERYFKGILNGSMQSGQTFNFRFRYQFRTNFEILKLSNGNAYPLLSLDLGDEIFINAGKPIVYNVFDQNRFVAGPSVSFSKDFAIGMIYNNQFAAVDAPASYVHTNAFWLTIRQNFDISQHKKHHC